MELRVLIRKYKLTYREQYIQITNDSKSNLQNATCGVPQGSILVPLLFLVAVNGLPSFSKILNAIMFADDIIAFMSTKISSNVLPQQMKN